MLPITLAEDGTLLVEDEALGKVEGFRFEVDPAANHADRKMLLAAGEKALPGILSQRAEQLLAAGLADLTLEKGAIHWLGRELAKIEIPDDFGTPRLIFPREISALPDSSREKLEEGPTSWLSEKLAPLEPLRKLSEAARDPEAGSQARALLVTLIDARGVVAREKAGLEHLPKEMRPFLRKLGVTFGALDIFARDLLKPAPRQLLHALGLDDRPLQEAMLPVISESKSIPAGYRLAGSQVIRVDLAEKILRAAFDTRAKAAEKPVVPSPEATPAPTEADQEAEAAANSPAEPKAAPAKPSKPRHSAFQLDLSLPVSIGLEEENARRLLGSAGFRVQRPKALAEGEQGPVLPDSWTWRPRRTGEQRNDRRKAGGKGKRPHPDRQNRKARGKGKPQTRNSQGGQPKRGGGKPHGSRNQRPKPDFGPARAGGAFDQLADLLKQ